MRMCEYVGMKAVLQAAGHLLGQVEVALSLGDHGWGDGTFLHLRTEGEGSQR